MRYITGFNEDISNFTKEIKELCSYSLSYLQDEGFSYNIDSYNDDQSLLFINGSSEVKFIDILPDLQQFIELLLNISIIKNITVSFYYKSLNGYELGSSASSRSVRETLSVYKILNDDFSRATYNTNALIIFSFELGKKKAPLLKRIKSFF